MRLLHGARALAAGLFAVIAASGVAAAQAPPDEAQVKAAFLYNFLKFVEWPADVFLTRQDSLIVGIVGGGPTPDAAARLLDGKLVQGRWIAIRRLKADGPCPAVHALFIGQTDASQTQRLLDAVANVAVLSIGEREDFAQNGGVIGLLVEAQKVRFEINTDAAATARLRISSKLLALARIVHATKAQQDTAR
jgi:hypothetical protein